MKKLKKFISVILLSCLFLCTIQGTVFASNYILSGTGHNTASVSVNSIGMSIYKSYWYSSRDAWNNSCYKVNLSDTYTETNHRIDEMPFPDAWYGLTLKTPAGSRCTDFQILINTQTCTSSIVQSTIVHELGHVLNLGDNDLVVSPNNSIMNRYRDRTILKTPTSDDVAGVMATY